MRTVYTANQFKKDFKLAERRGKDMQKMQAIVDLIAAETALPVRCRPHKLSGQYEDQWECHIESDWLLIWDIRENEVWLNRLGTHSDLFG
jgi:mRNA interferase YafQ